MSCGLGRHVACALALATLLLSPAFAQPSRPLRLVVLGDSLSAGFLLAQEAAFPAQLETELRRRGYPVTVANAAYTNDTSWDALARIDRDVPPGTDAVIVELGANDQLRLVDPAVTQGVLQQIVARLKSRRIAVLLAGFRMPFEWGAGSHKFDTVYQSVARQYGTAYYPDFYAGVFAVPGYTGVDGVHPSPAGVQRIVAGILPTVTRFLASVPAGAGR